MRPWLRITGLKVAVIHLKLLSRRSIGATAKNHEIHRLGLKKLNSLMIDILPHCYFSRYVKWNTETREIELLQILQVVKKEWIFITDFYYREPVEQHVTRKREGKGLTVRSLLTARTERRYGHRLHAGRHNWVTNSHRRHIGWRRSESKKVCSHLKTIKLRNTFLVTGQ